MSNSRIALWVLFAAVVPSVSCGFLGPDEPDEKDVPECPEDVICDHFPIDSMTVRGRIDTLFRSLPTLLFSGYQQPSFDSTVDPHPDSAVAAFPEEDGRGAGVGRGVADPESYIITSVPAGSADLLVAIIDTAYQILGGVLVLDRTRRGDTLVTEPVTAETSLERAVYQALGIGHQRLPFIYRPPQVALVHRFTEEVAGQAAMEPEEIRALADAFEPAMDVFIQGFLSMAGGYDTLDVNGGLREPAQAYAEARDGGTPTTTAHDAFIDGAIDVYIEGAGTPAQVATAWGAFATLHDAELAGRTNLTRLQSAQNLLHLSVTARQALVATVADGTAGKAAVSAALDDILAAGMAATDLASFVDAVCAKVQEGEAALEAARGADLSAELQAADLSAHIDTAISPEEIAGGLPDYLAGVESEEGDSELAALLIALMVGPGYAEG